MVVFKVLREFARGTSIHGFTFLVRPKSSSSTKIIWAISLVVALTYATLEMRNSVVGKYDYIFETRNLTSDYHCICKNSLVERSIFQIFWKPQYIFSSRNQNCCNISPWASNKENLEYVVQYQIPYSREQKHVSISDTPMLLIEINSISNMGCQK